MYPKSYYQRRYRDHEDFYIEGPSDIDECNQYMFDLDRKNIDYAIDRYHDGPLGEKLFTVYYNAA